ncbi:MAG: hypothetical protein AAF291_03540 [Pseudomonadota bacterium]
MKTIIIATGLALASLATPQMAFAQEEAPATQIIVAGQYQKSWDRGHKLEAEGLTEMQKAKRDLVKHSAAVVNAQDLRDTSQSRADNAREAFESLTARPFFSDAEDARKWAKQVESAASNWEKYTGHSERGAKDLLKAQGRQADAQAAVEKAQAKIDRGLAMKADAERASLRQAAR